MLLRSNSRDGYQVHFLGEEGIMLRNPLSCGILYCDAEDTEVSNDGLASVGA